MPSLLVVFLVRMEGVLELGVNLLVERLRTENRESFHAYQTRFLKSHLV